MVMFTSKLPSDHNVFASFMSYLIYLMNANVVVYG